MIGTISAGSKIPSHEFKNTSRNPNSRFRCISTGSFSWRFTNSLIFHKFSRSRPLQYQIHRLHSIPASALTASTDSEIEVDIFIDGRPLNGDGWVSSSASTTYISSIHVRYLRMLCLIYRARAHALVEQLQRDGALAVQEALHFEALQEGESAKEIGKKDNTNQNITRAENPTINSLNWTLNCP